jgi:hypothetical protein
MMKWAKERDSLIAQTRAFVNSVIAWKADITPPAGSVHATAIENTFAVRLREELEQIETIEKQDEAGENAVTEETVQALPVAELPLPKVASPTPPSEGDTLEKQDALQEQDTLQQQDTLQKQETVQNDVRKEIQSRVAAFQAHQHRFAREREAYFNSVLTKARSSLNGGDDDNPHDEPSA